MIFKTKKYEHDLGCSFNADFHFWGLPFSIFLITTPPVGCLAGGWHIIFRFLCFSFSVGDQWWSEIITDVGDSIGDIIDGY